MKDITVWISKEERAKQFEELVQLGGGTDYTGKLSEFTDGLVVKISCGCCQSWTQTFAKL